VANAGRNRPDRSVPDFTSARTLQADAGCGACALMADRIRLAATPGRTDPPLDLA
jgi:hypothetical protein